MLANKSTLNKNLILVLILFGVWLLWLPRVFESTSSAAKTSRKVHIAFGLHVNLYHSYRGDTNDENGFGQDIRAIRHTLHELDRFNKKGIPVRAVWDSNTFLFTTALHLSMLFACSHGNCRPWKPSTRCDIKIWKPVNSKQRSSGLTWLPGYFEICASDRVKSVFGSKSPSFLKLLLTITIDATLG